MASLLLPKSMSIPTIEAMEDMLEVRLLPVVDSGASITDALYSLGVPKATARPRTAAMPRNTAIISLSLPMTFSSSMKSTTIFLLFLSSISVVFFSYRFFSTRRL